MASRSLNNPVTRKDIDEAFEALEGEVDAITTSGPTLTRTIGWDDFDHDVASFWTATIGVNGEALVGPSAIGVSSLPSSGVVVLGTQAGADNACHLRRSNTALVLDTDEPIVTEWRFTLLGTDDEFNWLLGITGPDLTDGPTVVFGGLWDDGTSTRTHAIITLDGGGLNIDPFTLPALGGGSAYRARLTVTQTGSTLEIAIDEGEYSTVGTSAVAPVGIIYSPYINVSDGTDTARRVLIDYVRWNALRAGTDGVDATPTEDYLTAISGGSSSNGSLTQDGTVTSASYSISDSESLVLVEATANDVVLDFPTSPSSPGPRWWIIRGRWNGYKIQLLVDGTQTFNDSAGPSTLTLSNSLNGESLWMVVRQSGDTTFTVKRLDVRPDVENMSGTTDTVEQSDDGRVVYCTNAAGATITVPTGLKIGTTVEYVQGGAGQVEIVAGGGMFLIHPATYNPKTAETYSSLVITIMDTNSVLIRGDLEAV